LKENLFLEGNAEEIYIRASYLSTQMIRRIVEEQPEPYFQIGKVVVFKRRKPDKGRIPELPDVRSLTIKSSAVEASFPG
jgi:methionyl-tRNA formyltransferase